MRTTLIWGVAILASLVLSYEAIASPVYWDPATGGNGHYYDIVNDITINWNQARTAAEASGGYLATITSSSENDFIVNLGNTVGAFGRYALGGVNDNSWITGEPFTYTNWAPGEPNSDEENTIMIYMNQTYPSQWNDLSATEVLDGGYVVEYNTFVPEPSTLALFSLGAIGLLIHRRVRAR